MPTSCPQQCKAQPKMPFKFGRKKGKLPMLIFNDVRKNMNFLQKEDLCLFDDARKGPGGKCFNLFKHGQVNHWKQMSQLVQIWSTQKRANMQLSTYELSDTLEKDGSPPRGHLYLCGEGTNASSRSTRWLHSPDFIKNWKKCRPSYFSRQCTTRLSLCSAGSQICAGVPGLRMASDHASPSLYNSEKEFEQRTKPSGNKLICLVVCSAVAYHEDVLLETLSHYWIVFVAGACYRCIWILEIMHRGPSHTWFIGILGCLV